MSWLSNALRSEAFRHASALFGARVAAAAMGALLALLGVPLVVDQPPETEYYELCSNNPVRTP